MDVLFLTLPYAALRRDRFRTHNVIDLGASIILGSLECHNDYQVDAYDLNAKLLRQLESGDQYLTAKELRILTDADTLFEFLRDPDKESLVYKWAVSLIEDLDLSKYDIIAAQVPRRYPELQLVHASLFFGAILSTLLPTQLILGGKLAANLIGDSLIKRIVDCANANIEIYIPGQGDEVLTTYLDRTRHTSSSADVRPSYNIKNIDEMTYPPGLIFSEEILQKYDIVRESFAIGSYKFSDGCLFRCSFCMSGPIPLKYGDPIQAVDHLETLVDQGVTDFHFLNSNINFHQKYVLTFCNEVVRRNLEIQFMDSANLILGTEEIYSALREAGCIKLWYGAESFSPAVLKRLEKKNKLEKVIEVLKMADANGIWTALNLIVNFPYETQEEIDETVRFLQEKKEYINSISVSRFLLFPNTELYNNPKDHNITIIGHDVPYGDWALNEWYENDGLHDFQEILARGLDHQQQILDVKPVYDMNCKFDWQYFALRKQYDKPTTIKIMEDAGITDHGQTGDANYKNSQINPDLILQRGRRPGSDR